MQTNDTPRRQTQRNSIPLVGFPSRREKRFSRARGAAARTMALMRSEFLVMNEGRTKDETEQPSDELWLHTQFDAALSNLKCQIPGLITQNPELSTMKSFVTRNSQFRLFQSFNRKSLNHSMASFVSQRHHGMDLCRPPRRDVTCREGDGNQNQ
jgi:hypothetical protein